MKILVADDEQPVRTLVAMILEERGHRVLSADNGLQAVRLFDEERPDLVVLDVMMPKLDGFDACLLIRRTDPGVPVLFLSAKGDVDNRVMGLKVGADDYLPKPFDNEELALRIEPLLRRRATPGTATASADAVFQTGPFRFDRKRLQLTRDGRDIPLTVKEFQILSLLASHPGEVLSGAEIIESIWGAEYRDESVSIPVYVRRIRSKVEEDPSRPYHLKTIRSKGYYFQP